MARCVRKEEREREREKDSQNFIKFNFGLYTPRYTVTVIFRKF